MIGDIFSAIAAIAAGISAIWAWWVYRGQSRAADFELARSLHQDLTTGEVARARDALTRYRLTGQCASTDEVVHAYFTLLWCFERILRGRESISRRTPRIGAQPALDYLDACMDWHLRQWEHDFPEVQRRIKADLGVKKLDNADTFACFSALVEAVSVKSARRHAPRPASVRP